MIYSGAWVSALSYFSAFLEFFKTFLRWKEVMLNVVNSVFCAAHVQTMDNGEVGKEGRAF